MQSTVSAELKRKLDAYRLNKTEYDRICDLLGHEPKGVEWALFSALWSEHCSYKSSRRHLKKFFSKSPRVVQSFGENAGVVDLGEGERVAFKMESHNHPSFIEPTQGAATGVGGILRDIFTMGARPIALANYLCFGEATAERMPFLVDGVVRGIGGYGNCVGVPTVTGQTEFHESYNGNILVNAMAVGLFRPGEKIFLSKACGQGNYVVYVGAKTGRDGVHGASMASESFDDNNEAKKPNVQIGDPFFEKLLIESCLEVMQEDLVAAIQDMGAAGLTSSSFEMASKGGVGLTLHLDKVPLRDSHTTPEEILLSESQERMLLICEPHKFNRLQEVFHKWDLDATVIGEVLSEKLVKLYWKNELLTALDPDLLVENAPNYDRPYQKWTPKHRVSDAQELMQKKSKFDVLSALKSVQGCSRQWIFSQYDQRVGYKTVRDSRSDVAVMRLPDSKRGLGIVLGCRPHVMRFDAQLGAMDAIAHPALELASKGFEALAVTDCLNFGNPEKPDVMSEFVAAVEGMSEMCQALTIPVVSGNVSFYNETKGQNVTSTPSTGVIGLRPDIAGIPNSSFVGSGDKVYLLRSSQAIFSGMQAELTQQPVQGFGQISPGMMQKFVPWLTQLCRQQAVRASRVVGKFGLGYALARMTLDGVGISIEASSVKEANLEASLGLEQLYEVIVVLDVKQEAQLKDLLKQGQDLGLSIHYLGLTGGDKLKIAGVCESTIQEIKETYTNGWHEHFAGIS